jgi:flagellar motor switch protein FliG
MKIRVDGFQSAIEMLQGLDREAQEHLLEQIALKDPEMAEKLRKNIVSFSDLIFLTTAMVKRLLQDIQLEDLGLALRGTSPELISHFMNMFSSNMKSDVEEALKGKPRPLTEVLEAQKRIMDVVLKLREKGEIVISRNNSEKYV